MLVGIDCGAYGAIAFFSDNGYLIEVSDMPAIDVKVGKSIRRRVAPAPLAEMLRSREVTRAFVEQVGPMPTDGSQQAFGMGRTSGIVEGVLAALGIGTAYVTSPVWKRFLELGKDKGLSRQKAMQLFPGAADRFARVKDDGRADAVLIGWYGAMKTMREAA